MEEEEQTPCLSFGLLEPGWVDNSCSYANELRYLRLEAFYLLFAPALLVTLHLGKRYPTAKIASIRLDYSKLVANASRCSLQVDFWIGVSFHS